MAGCTRMVNTEYPRKESRGAGSIMVEPTVPRRRQEMLRINGWGFADATFYVKDGLASCTSDRYKLSGSDDSSNLPSYFEDRFGIKLPRDLTLQEYTPLQEHEYTKSQLDEEHMAMFRSMGMAATREGIDRYIHGFGKGTLDIVMFAENRTDTRIPDAVVWPNCHEDCVQVVKIATEQNWVLVPFGGGTAVSGALLLPDDEDRPIISLDMNRMTEILWVDRESLIICVEAGITGMDLEKALTTIGFTVGHEPDSFEFSTLGGWVATRASGMKKNTYGNIEDLVVHTRMVTATGILEKGSRAPRMSSGPDFNEIVLGSEGNFGVITEVCLKIRPLPQTKKYASVVFRTFEIGVNCMREITQKKLEPTNIRLMDSDMYEFSTYLKSKSKSYTARFLNYLKMSVLHNVLGFDKDAMCAMTLLYEGNEDEVVKQEQQVNEIIKAHGGIHGGSENSRRGYLMTFIIAYVRDLTLDFQVLSESLETCVPWTAVLPMCRELKQQYQKEVYKLGVLQCNLLIRISQVYETGCCIYMYYGLFAPTRVSKVQCIHLVEDVIRKIILKHGGSVSHHHGVGKCRQKFYEDAVSKTGVGLLQALKTQIDPNNIFGIRNLSDDITGDADHSREPTGTTS